MMACWLLSHLMVKSVVAFSDTWVECRLPTVSADVSRHFVNWEADSGCTKKISVMLLSCSYKEYYLL